MPRRSSLTSERRLLAAALLAALSASLASDAGAPPPTVEWASPAVTYPSELDLDGNRIIDILDEELDAMSARDHPGDEFLDIMVFLRQPPGAEDVEAFQALGGIIFEVWRHATYGLWGAIPWTQIERLPNVLAGRVNIIEPVEEDGIANMDVATQIVQARNRTWTTYGYDGDPEGTLVIFDSGIDGPHNDLADHDNDNQFNDPDDWNDACTNGWDAAYRMQGWWNNYSSSVNPVDPDGHGTAVAGCAAGDGSLNSSLKGIAPASHLAGFRIGQGTNQSSARAISAMNTVIANKVCARIKAANLSISYDPVDPSQVTTIANNVVRNGIVFSVAAGNGYDNGTCYSFYYVMHPGRADKVITVGATNDNDQMAGYSSHGPPGVAKPDVVAPGGGLGGTNGTINTCDNNPDDGYQTRIGTSFSAPIVCGAASLLIDAHEQATGSSWTWSETDARRIKGVILMTAVEIDTTGENPPYTSGCNEDPPPNSPGTKSRGGHDRIEGYGRINVDAAVEALTMELCAGEVGRDSLSAAATDKKVWARQIAATGPCVNAYLAVPSGADYDLYLYQTLPDTSGVPVIRGKSTTASVGTDEFVSLNIGFTSESFYLVAKWVSGSGPFNVYFLDATEPEFTDVTTQIQDTGWKSMDVVWADYDTDGDDDLFMTGTGNEERLYENNGGGTLSNVAAFNDLSFTRAATWGDYDGDGDLDLYLGGGAFYGTNDTNKNRLYRNDGNGAFSDVTMAAGVGHIPTTWDVSWVDFDNDNDLDLCLAVHSDVITPDPPVCPNVLYENTGSGFTDVGASVGVNDSSRTAAVVWGDYDDDGDQDLYTVNYDSSGNRLFRNDGLVSGQWTFTDVTSGPLASSGDCTDGAWGDFDGDGDLDLYVARANAFDSGANQLLRNDGNGAFTDVTVDVLKAEGISTSASWIDYDSDGDLDLLVTNYGEDNRLIQNKGLQDGQWTWVDASVPILAAAGNARAAAWGDYDVDGDFDLMLALAHPDTNSLFDVGEIACSGSSVFAAGLSQAGLYNRLQIRLQGTTSNESGIGARITVVAGGARRIREIESYSGSAQAAFFGLGVSTTVESLIVRWPSGNTQVATGLPANNVVTVNEGPASSVGDDIGSIPKVCNLHLNYPNPFNPTTTIRYDLPQAGPVTIRIFDVKGRFIRSLLSGEVRGPGTYTVVWDGRNGAGQSVSSGVYFCRLVAGGTQRTQRMVLLK